MPIEDVISGLACTSCEERGILEVRGKGAEVDCVCQVCGSAYPYRNGILDMIKDTIDYSWAQRAFLSRLWVSLYGSYRRSFLSTWTTGMSHSEEKELLIDLLDLKGDETVLDLACGSGYFSEVFLGAFPRLRLIGCDLSPKMLDVARDRLSGLYGERLFLVRGDAMRLPARNDSIQRLSCCGGLHDFPDPYKSLEEISRVMGNDGAYFAGLTFACEDSDNLGKLNEWMKRLFGVTQVGKKQMKEKLEDEGFGGLRWQQNRSVAYFSASR